MMNVHESGEMYLEAILVLSRKNGFVRSIDVGEYLGYSKPSVSRAMGLLRKGGLIIMEKDGGLYLTDSGRSHCGKDLRAPYGAVQGACQPGGVGDCGGGGCLQDRA